MASLNELRFHTMNIFKYSEMFEKTEYRKKSNREYDKITHLNRQSFDSLYEDGKVQSPCKFVMDEDVVNFN
jgi:hypothetical protein